MKEQLNNSLFYKLLQIFLYKPRTTPQLLNLVGLL